MTHAAIVEINVEAPRKTTSRTAVQCCHASPGHYPRARKSAYRRDACTPMLMEALFTTPRPGVLQRLCDKENVYAHSQVSFSNNEE
jgi:hypothetical protein